ncbi:hypothetical protein N7478_009819 [Penicillium angulare]|uniref:uncharacterized protein n=1 Tax=Penicillium angulare TaxID=116970 RepID=UPI00253F7BE4|nr:uncharacterized protein N7478_009819 [Penicillium angulare]KAJ5267011.1 hypothetical protein N7478_009819 [Penicillium angulare]
MSLSGKVAIITGSSNGIGKAAALRLASEGANLVINYRSDAKAANDVVNQIGPDRALAIQADASKLPDLDRLVSETLARFGKIDILILNAGQLPMKDLENTTEEDFDSSYNLMVKGPYFLAQKASKHMQPGSRIIFVSTTVTAFSSVAPSYLLYASAKGAVEQMARVAAKDLGRKGILVNTVAPGPTMTDLFTEGKSEQLIKTLAAANPLNRIGEADEIAAVMAFLSGKDSSWMTGQILRVNGGMA